MKPISLLPFILPILLPETWPVQGVPYDFSSQKEMPESWPSMSIPGAALAMFGAPTYQGALTRPLSQRRIGEWEQRRLGTAGTLIAFLDLRDNWDGEGAVGPTPDSIGQALQMLELIPLEIRPPKAMLLATGDVAIYWQFGNTYAEIGFDGSGNYYAFAEATGLESVHIDAAALFDGGNILEFPHAIRRILTNNDAILKT